MILLPGTLALLLGFSLLICKTEGPGSESPSSFPVSLESTLTPTQFYWQNGFKVSRGTVVFLPQLLNIHLFRKEGHHQRGFVLACCFLWSPDNGIWSLQCIPLRCQRKVMRPRLSHRQKTYEPEGIFNLLHSQIFCRIIYTCKNAQEILTYCQEGFLFL